MAWAAAYLAYGEARPRKERLRQPLRLAGQYHDHETGLHQNRWRSFDPCTGRYLSPDPLGLLGGLNLYAYAEQDPVGNTDPLGLFPGLGDLMSHLLPPQAMQGARQLQQRVTQGVLNHLGPLRSLLPPANPRPPEPERSVVHPNHHLPPLPAQAASPHHQASAHHAPAHQAPAHHAPAHHAPAPARAAAHCAPAPHAAAPASHAAAPHPAAPPAAEPHTLLNWTKNQLSIGTQHSGLYNFVTGFTGVPGPNGHGGIATVFTQGVQDNFAFEKNTATAAAQSVLGHPAAAAQSIQGATDALNRNVEVLKSLVPFGGSHGLLAQYAEAGGDGATSLFLPPDQAAALRQEGGAAWHQANHNLGDMAYHDPFDVGLNLLPLGAAGRLATLGRLSKMMEAANAAGDVERAARIGKAMEALQGGKAGAALRGAKAQAVKKLSAKSRATLTKVQAAAAKHQERRLNEQERQLQARRLASPEEMKARWRNQGSGRGGGYGRTPALAGVSGGGRNATKAIGKQSLIQRMAGKGEQKPRPPLEERIRLNRNIKTRPDVEPVKSTKKDYWSFDLARKSREFRRTYVDENGKVGFWGTGNVVVYEYKDANGDLLTHAAGSIPQGPGRVNLHSEPNGLKQLHNMGIDLKNITRVYTEREPCMSKGNYCGTLLSSELPGIPVFHSFEYGDGESQIAGNKLLEAAIRQAKGSDR